MHAPCGSSDRGRTADTLPTPPTPRGAAPALPSHSPGHALNRAQGAQLRGKLAKNVGQVLQVAVLDARGHIEHAVPDGADARLDAVHIEGEVVRGAGLRRCVVEQLEGRRRTKQPPEDVAMLH